MSVAKLDPSTTALVLIDPQREVSALPYGTDLDLQLRRRGINTIVVGGIATNFGVESTARAAQGHSHNVVLVEDAMSGLSADDHNFAIAKIFPLIGRVVSTGDAVASIAS